MAKSSQRGQPPRSDYACGDPYEVRSEQRSHLRALSCRYLWDIRVGGSDSTRGYAGLCDVVELVWQNSGGKRAHLAFSTKPSNNCFIAPTRVLLPWMSAS